MIKLGLKEIKGIDKETKKIAHILYKERCSFIWDLRHIRSLMARTDVHREYIDELINKYKIDM